MTRQKAINISDTLLEEASTWHARLSDDAAGEEVWLSFTDWLEADEMHRHAYDHVEDVAMEVADMVDAASELMAQSKSEHQSVGGGEVIQAAWRWRNRNIWGGVAAAAAAVMLVIANIGVFNNPAAVTQEYMTGFGEQQVVQLEDGSTVHLNTNSKLEVILSDDERRTRLAHGEALFSVAKDSDRPFYVAAGDRQIKVVGTKFNVLRHAGNITVTVSEGIVDVAPKSGDIVAVEHTKRLTAGKQLVSAEGSAVSDIRDVEAETFLAWESGILAYEDTPLSITINELSRYFEKPINIIGDISHITFSGVLNVRDPEAVLALLEETLPITITQSADVITVTADT